MVKLKMKYIINWSYYLTSIHDWHMSMNTVKLKKISHKIKRMPMLFCSNLWRNLVALCPKHLGSGQHMETYTNLTIEQINFHERNMISWIKISMYFIPWLIIIHHHRFYQTLNAMNIEYRKVSNIRRTFVGNKIVDHSDVVGASPVGAAPTTSSFST